MLVFTMATSSLRFDKERLREIIQLGRKALRQRQADELASDLLGLDGVSLPREPASHLD